MIYANNSLTLAGLERGGHVGDYTFTQTGSCTSSNWKDPINIVFYDSTDGTHATHSYVGTHAGHHGNWTVQGGDGQRFYDHYVCQNMHAPRASGPPTQLPGRFHMRYRTGTSGGGFDWDYNLGGYFTVAAAHH
jgi:hypothetical protein